MKDIGIFRIATEALDVALWACAEAVAAGQWAPELSELYEAATRVRKMLGEREKAARDAA